MIALSKAGFSVFNQRQQSKQTQNNFAAFANQQSGMAHVDKFVPSISFGSAPALMDGPRVFTPWKKLSIAQAKVYVLSHYGRTYVLPPDININKMLVEKAVDEWADQIYAQSGDRLRAGEPLRVLEAGHGAVEQFFPIYELLRREVQWKLGWPEGRLNMEVVLAEPTPAFRRLSELSLDPSLVRSDIVQSKTGKKANAKALEKAEKEYRVIQSIWDKFFELTDKHYHQLVNMPEYMPVLTSKKFTLEDFLNNGNVKINVVDSTIEDLEKKGLAGFDFALTAYVIGSTEKDETQFKRNIAHFVKANGPELPFAMLMMEGTRDWPAGARMTPPMADYDRSVQHVLSTAVGKLTRENKPLDAVLPAFPVTRKDVERTLYEFRVGGREVVPVADDDGVREEAHGMLVATGEAPRDYPYYRCVYQPRDNETYVYGPGEYHYVDERIAELPGKLPEVFQGRKIGGYTSGHNTNYLTAIDYYLMTTAGHSRT